MDTIVALTTADAPKQFLHKGAVLFLGHYLAYTLSVLLNVMEHQAPRQFTKGMVFALPLTTVALAGLTLRERLAGSANGSESPAR